MKFFDPVDMVLVIALTFWLGYLLGSFGKIDMIKHKYKLEAWRATLDERALPREYIDAVDACIRKLED